MNLHRNLCGVFLVAVCFVLGCAETIQESARAAAPAAVEGTVAEAHDPKTRDRIAEILRDPDIRGATAAMSESVVNGAIDALAKVDQQKIQRMLSALVGEFGKSLAHSFEKDLGPQIASVVATSVDQSLNRALDQETEQRLEAIALAVARGTVHGLGQQLVDANGQPSPVLALAVGQFARQISREAAFGFQDAVHETELRRENGQGHQGDVLALAGESADVTLGILPFLWVGLGLLSLALLGALVFAVLRLRHHRRLRYANERAALTLVHAIRTAESEPWANGLRQHLERTTRDGLGGRELDRFLQEHGELRREPARSSTAYAE